MRHLFDQLKRPRAPHNTLQRVRRALVEQATWIACRQPLTIPTHCRASLPPHPLPSSHVAACEAARQRTPPTEPRIRTASTTTRPRLRLKGLPTSRRRPSMRRTPAVTPTSTQNLVCPWGSHPAISTTLPEPHHRRLSTARAVSIRIPVAASSSAQAADVAPTKMARRCRGGTRSSMATTRGGNTHIQGRFLSRLGAKTAPRFFPSNNGSHALLPQCAPRPPTISSARGLAASISRRHRRLSTSPRHRSPRHCRPTVYLAPATSRS
mmetsp:Transcript_50851/g.156936  ORF Transcript_50851/g.156936 Transcript_50851/m.156936 type:complete len:266 (-) Transcript_50851:574-1371(-)